MLNTRTSTSIHAYMCMFTTINIDNSVNTMNSVNTSLTTQCGTHKHFNTYMNNFRHHVHG